MPEINNVAAFGYEIVHNRLKQVEEQLRCLGIAKEMQQQGNSIEEIRDFLNTTGISQRRFELIPKNE